MKPSLSTLLLAAIPIAGLANEEPGKWDRLSFEVPSEATRAVVTIEGSESLGMVTLKLDSETFHVPAEELEGIDGPILETARLLLGEGFYGPIEENEEAVPHFLVELQFGEKTSFTHHPKVQFLFHTGDYRERIELTPTSVHTWSESRKAPGEEPIETGTITVPPPTATPPPVPDDEDPEAEKRSPGQSVPFQGE